MGLQGGAFLGDAPGAASEACEEVTQAGIGVVDGEQGVAAVAAG